MTHTRFRGAPIAVLLGEGSTADTDETRRLLVACGLPIVAVSAHELTLAAPTVGIFAREHPPVAGCHAWYVGPGPGPSWMHRTLGHGHRTTNQILRLLGTALVQEGAGAAFRAAGLGLPAPDEVAFDPGVLRGVDRAVAPVKVAGVAPPTPAIDPESLLRKAFAAIERCATPEGAIAAAPRGGAGRPDYWFFWQRDAAAAAIALRRLADAGPPDLRERAAARCERYVAFVDRLGRTADHGSSRATMSGSPVRGYGDPQHDGPAGTVLAVLTCNPGALDVTRPYLEHLLRPGPREGFDLWELTRGRSFHAENLRRRALRRAAQVATGVDDDLARRCRVGDERAAFVDPAGGWCSVLNPEPAWFAETTRLDAGVVGSALLAFSDDIDAHDIETHAIDADAIDIDDPYLAATVARLEEHYAPRWPVNVAWQRAGNLGAGIGRFPEDANDGLGSTGGNPWPIATLWMAQYHFHRGNRELAEGYLEFVLAHVDADAISEQVDAVSGKPRGARGLAWAHAELIITLLARGRQEG